MHPHFTFLVSSSSTHFCAIILWIPLLTSQETWWKNSSLLYFPRINCCTLSRNYFLSIGIFLFKITTVSTITRTFVTTWHSFGWNPEATLNHRLTYHSPKDLNTTSLCLSYLWAKPTAEMLATLFQKQNLTCTKSDSSHPVLWFHSHTLIERLQDQSGSHS